MTTRSPAIPPTGHSFLFMSGSGIVKTGDGILVLVLIASSSSLVIRLWDNTAASGTKIVGSLTVGANEEYDLPAYFATGLYVEFASGSGELTVFYI